MAGAATLVLLFLIAQSVSARHGTTFHSSRHGNGRSNARRPASNSPFQVAPGQGGDQSTARTCSSASSTKQVDRECASKSAEPFKALTLVRGGGRSKEPSVFALFVQVFVPSFGREGEEKKEGLDLEAGGMMRRLKRFVSGVFRKVPGLSTSADPKGKTANTAGEKGAKGKGKAATATHLEKTYRPGNANYRIQKELKEFMANPPDNCKVSVGKNIRVWIITISGAKGTVYEGEKFRLRVAFPEDYPTKPPAVYFLQSPPPPRHQHIYTNGDICLSLLSSRDWKPNLTVMSLALSILSMLSSAKEKRIPEDNAAHAEARPGQAQQWIYHDDLC